MITRGSVPGAWPESVHTYTRPSWILMLPAGWIGIFAFGDTRSRGINRVDTHPNPHRIAVTSRGAGYLLDVRDPHGASLSMANPVLHVLPVVSHQLLVFGDFIRLVA